MKMKTKHGKHIDNALARDMESWFINKRKIVFRGDKVFYVIPFNDDLEYLVNDLEIQFPSCDTPEIMKAISYLEEHDRIELVIGDDTLVIEIIVNSSETLPIPFEDKVLVSNKVRRYFDLFKLDDKKNERVKIGHGWSYDEGNCQVCMHEYNNSTWQYANMSDVLKLKGVDTFQWRKKYELQK